MEVKKINFLRHYYYNYEIEKTFEVWINHVNRKLIWRTMLAASAFETETSFILIIE